MPPDFPAAHSMDTHWFAVDACGHVAMFDSGEPGVVAEGACISHDEVEPGLDVQAALLPVLPRTRAIFTTPRRETHLDARAWENQELPKLVFVADEREAAAMLAQAGARRESCDRGVVIHVTAVAPDVVRQVHDAGTCLSCRMMPLAWRPDGLVTSEASRVGLYHYDHRDYSDPTPPYLRLSVPDRAAHLDELPKPLGERLGAVRLAGCFARSEELQPAEQVRCVGWLPAWLDVSRRRVHPTPLEHWAGPFSPADYARYIARAGDDLRARGITWDPPTVPDPGTEPTAPTPPPRRPPGLLTRLLRRLLR